MGQKNVMCNLFVSYGSIHLIDKCHKPSNVDRKCQSIHISYMGCCTMLYNTAGHHIDCKSFL
jgi:hypothetical protein